MVGGGEFILLVKPKIAFSLKCASCGKAKLHVFDVFRLTSGSRMCVCDCRKTCMNLSFEAGCVTVEFLCPYCRQIHVYRLSMHDLICGELNELMCGKTKLICAYAGKPDQVERKVKDYQTAIDMLLRELSDVPRFSQTPSQRIKEDFHSSDTAMAAHIACSIYTVKEMIYSHRIHCPCGSKRYELAFLDGCVQIQCSDCGAYVRLSAKTEKELNQIRKAKTILLTK